MSSSLDNKRTVLYHEHIRMNAKMITDAGFEMPLYYDSIVNEHRATRESVTISDCCPLGEFRISGDSAIDDLERLVSCTVNDIQLYQCRYGFMCNQKGGVIDDLTIYRIAQNKFLMVVNAVSRDTDFIWIKNQCSKSTRITDVSAFTAKIDIQGPHSPQLVQNLLNQQVEVLTFKTFQYLYLQDTKILICRTCHTGEIGFRIYGPLDIASTIWNSCLKLGAKPMGLGALESLRIEMGIPLIGNEFSPDRNPMESGMTSAIDHTKHFIGSETITNPKYCNAELVGLIIEGRTFIPQKGEQLVSQDHRTTIGTITSAAFSHSLHEAIALGYVQKQYAAPGNTFSILKNRKSFTATVVTLPFYTHGSAQKSVSS